MRLGRRGAAQKDLEAAESAYAQARAELTRADARLITLDGAASGHSRDLVLTAPQGGVVTALAIASGAQVSDPTATLMTVTNLDQVFMTATTVASDAGPSAGRMTASPNPPARMTGLHP
jgi:membrane fusion protein, heavy metal efflux system